MLRDDPEEYNRMVRTMTRRQSSGRGRQARNVVGVGNEGGVAGPGLEGEDAGEQAAEQEEEDQDEAGAGAAGGGGEAYAEDNPVDGGEAAAEEWVDPAAAEVDEVNNEEEAVDGEGVDPAEGEAGDEEHAEEGA